jgi:hypothetical protein
VACGGRGILKRTLVQRHRFDTGVIVMPILRILCFALVGIGVLGAGAVMFSRKGPPPAPEPVRVAFQPETCTDTATCIAGLRAIAQARRGDCCGGMGAQEDALASRLRAMPGVVDAMVPLLADADIDVAKLAAYVLRDVETIDPRHLPAIRAGLDRDLGWLAPALARIGTDAAAEEAVKRLLAEDNTGNQEAYAVELFGARAIPAIVAAARSPMRTVFWVKSSVVWKRKVAQRFPGCWRSAKTRSHRTRSPSARSA